MEPSHRYRKGATALLVLIVSLSACTRSKPVVVDFSSRPIYPNGELGVTKECGDALDHTMDHGLTDQQLDDAEEASLNACHSDTEFLHGVEDRRGEGGLVKGSILSSLVRGHFCHGNRTLPACRGNWTGTPGEPEYDQWLKDHPEPRS